MTVEASYIVPMTLVCIIVMVFLMFYVYNQIALSADCYYLARKLSNVEIYEESYEFQEESKKVIKGNLVLPRNAQMLRKKGISNMVVTGEIEFYIPFMGTVAVNETQYACRKNNRKLLARYQQWKDVNFFQSYQLLINYSHPSLLK